MKYCPNCQTRYTDDTLRFCLQDGSPLAVETDENSAPTVPYGEPVQLNETETIISPRSSANEPPVERPAAQRNNAAPRSVEPIRIDLPVAPEPTPYQPQTVPVQTAAAPRRSNVLPLVLLTALATLLLAGVGAWLYMRNNNGAEVAKNTATNAGSQSSASNANAKSNVKNTPAPTVSPKIENSSIGFTGANGSASTPAPDVDPEQIKEEVGARVDDWIALTESRDLDAYMDYYAATVDYYNKRGASAASVRSDKQRAFENFDSIQMNISNLTVTPGGNGDRATAVFDKEWVFDGAEKSSSGKVKTELQMKKINGQWLIISERDLKIYYTE